MIEKGSYFTFSTAKKGQSYILYIFWRNHEKNVSESIASLFCVWGRHLTFYDGQKVKRGGTSIFRIIFINIPHRLMMNGPFNR